MNRRNGKKFAVCLKIKFSSNIQIVIHYNYLNETRTDWQMNANMLQLHIIYEKVYFILLNTIVISKNKMLMLFRGKYE